MEANSPCGSDYNHELTATIGDKIKQDGDASPAGTSREVVYNFWKQHPVFNENCCYNSDPEKACNEFMENLVQFEDNFYELVAGLNADTQLRAELLIWCSSNPSDLFCKIQNILPLIDSVIELPSSKSDWTIETEMRQKLISVGFVVLKRSHFPNLEIQEDNILIDATNMIINRIQNNELNLLETLSVYFPSTDYITPETSCESDHLCLFGKITEKAMSFVDEARLNANGSIINGKRTLMINTNTDYREFLKQKQLDRILEVLTEQQYTTTEIANELKQHMNDKFSELRSYFENIETFNSEIAKADIGFIHGRLELFRERVDAIAPQLDEKMDALLKAGFKVVIQDLAENLLKTAIVVASAFNPLKSYLGGGSLGDVLDTLAKLINTIGDLVELGVVRSRLNDLKTKIEFLNHHFADSQQFLEKVKALVMKDSANRTEFQTAKTTFISKYNEFNPKVSREELVGTQTLWIGLVDAVCNVVKSTDTSLGAPFRVDVEKKGYCVDTPILIERLYTVYGEIYDFQFELITAMASYTRSLVALDASNEIKNEFVRVAGLNPDEDQTLITLSLIGGLSYITYKSHVSNTIHLYCDILEYTEGGVRPSECKGLDTDVALLLANTIPECISETHSYFYNVPTKPAFEGDQAFIDIKQLFAGEWVQFQVPNSQWLVDKKWIQNYEKDFAIYVQQFEIYLPLDLGRKVKTFHTLADPILHNAVKPGGTEFIITPNVLMIHKYQMGPGQLPCKSQDRDRNPYTYCQNGGSQVCDLSHLVERPLHPSIYSHWNLKVVGADNVTSPNPATDLNLVFGMKLCQVKNEYSEELEEPVVNAQNQQPCCPGGQYRPNIEANCENCPPCSHSALSGYYCEKNVCKENKQSQ